MQLYRWRARSMAGKLYQGSYLADSKQEVAAFLHENYDYITGIRLRRMARPHVGSRGYYWDRRSTKFHC